MHIAPVLPGQLASLAELLAEIHAHYNAGREVAREVLEQHLRENLLGSGSALRLVVASADDGTVIGLAAMALLHSLVEPAPEHCRQLLVKELYVRSGHRGRGVGRALMAWVANRALDEGCCRVDWNVNAANPGAIAFYESLGGARVGDRLSYRLPREGMAALAGRAGGAG